jgi:polyisoprenoid-binding protein YceI
MTIFARIAALVLAAILAGCGTPPPPALPMPAQAASQANMQWYNDARKTGKRVWQIDSKASLIVVTVRRGGSLARLGHDHVVSSRTIEGLLAPDEGRADFQFRLDQMQVDESDLRREAGLTTAPSPEAIEGTRNNMLTKVLDAGRYPAVTLSVVRAAGAAAPQAGSTEILHLRISLHGVERSVEVPVRIETGTDMLSATGSFTLSQTAFGITPMSVLGGAIAVEDQMELRFSLVARQP